jgi:hypothetical protein
MANRNQKENYLFFRESAISKKIKKPTAIK